MKRVNVRNGLKQRLNEILGTDFGTDTPPEITPWSIQAAMVANLRRIISALVGDAGFGRPMKGLWLTKNSNTQFAISSGFGFTNAGDIVVLEVPIDVNLASTTNGNRYIYLKHQMAEVDGDLYPDGKKTGFIATQGLENIVYDDYAASKKTDLASALDSFGDPVVVQSATTLTGDEYVYLGYLTIVGNVIDSVTNSDVRGIAPNTPGGAYQIPSAEVTGNVTVGGNLTVEGQILADIIKAEGGLVIDIQNDVTLQEDLTMLAAKNATLPNPANVSFNGAGADFGPGMPTTMTIVNGIVTVAT